MFQGAKFSMIVCHRTFLFTKVLVKSPRIWSSHRRVWVPILSQSHQTSKSTVYKLFLCTPEARRRLFSFHVVIFLYFTSAQICRDSCSLVVIQSMSFEGNFWMFVSLSLDLGSWYRQWAASQCSDPYHINLDIITAQLTYRDWQTVVGTIFFFHEISPWKSNGKIRGEVKLVGRCWAFCDQSLVAFKRYSAESYFLRSIVDLL